MKLKEFLEVFTKTKISCDCKTYSQSKVVETKKHGFTIDMVGCGCFGGSHSDCIEILKDGVVKDVLSGVVTKEELQDCIEKLKTFCSFLLLILHLALKKLLLEL